MELQERIRAAFEKGTRLRITGSGTKKFLGPHCEGEAISTLESTGIVSYQPEELFITAKAGTSLSEIEAALAEKGQQFSFEPPAFGETATLGGTIACGLSGPARPWKGAARDFVLGSRLINGKGELLRFGGEVIKNVAGYDVSRLMCGAFGTLGVLTEVSIKVVPVPQKSLTLSMELDRTDALARVTELSRQPWPISAAAWYQGVLRIRLSGAEAAVDHAVASLGGEVSEASGFWTRLREQTHPFFKSTRSLWRLSLPQATPAIDLPGEELLDWGGAQRWLLSDEDGTTIRTIASEAGGHATAFRNPPDREDAFMPLAPPMLALHRRIKQAFDPGGILNPGRLYREL
ncbi:MAG: glycolate oxidase subunit GlcE [Gammaproteobacteria bacterium]|jgi:glycolate oxidase FAD binding subunit